MNSNMVMWNDKEKSENSQASWNVDVFVKVIRDMVNEISYDCIDLDALTIFPLLF